MNCPSCKTPIPSDATFCPNCGARSNPPAESRRPAGGTYSGLATVAPMREARASVLEPGTRFAERYEVIRKLGEGGMGVVYVAKDSNTGEEMVLKLIHPDLVTGEDAVKRLMAEGLTARQIRHPNIVAVYDVSQYNGQPYFTMEFVRGGTLRSWLVNGISAGREVSLGTAVGLMKTMLAGLAEAHRMGVVHRDLKPENVLLVGDPEAGNFDLKILDFGIAKAIGAAPATRSGGGPVGTPIYMAPEQMTAADAVGPAADFYSLSVMFYELLMDAPPQGRWEAVSKNRRDIPPAVDAIIEKGLSARPKSRFASAAEYEAALVALSGTKPPPIIVPDPPRPDPVPVPPPDPDPKPWLQGLGAGMSKRTRAIVAGVGVVAALGVIGNMVDTEPPGCDPSVEVCEPDPPPPCDPSTTKCDDEPDPPPAPNYAGYWIDFLGNRYDVTHEGSNISGRANTPAGWISFSGTLVNGIANFTVRGQYLAYVLTGQGRIYLDQAGLPHLSYTLSDGTVADFKINHVN